MIEEVEMIEEDQDQAQEIIIEEEKREEAQDIPQ